MSQCKKPLLTAVCILMLGATVAAGAQIVVRIGPPPPAPREVIPPPRNGFDWQPGYHRWDGAHYVWVPGAYAPVPHPGARWVPGHWANRGGGYVWVDGHWR